jgi:phosphoserine phosphatase
MELAPLKIRHSSHSQTAVETILPAQLSQGHCFPVLDLFARAQTFWQEILPKHQGQTIAIVSHGGTNRALISTALGIPPEQFHQMQQSNCGISRLEFPTGQLQSGRLTLLNRTSPTEEALPKLKEGKQGLRLLLLPSESDSSRNSQVQAIATRLQSIEIDFCLTCASDQPQAIAQQILQYHPRTMQIQSQRLHALTTWQRNIALNDQHPTQLMTSLVIAPMLEIQKMLSEALNIPPNQMHRIPLKPETLTILHYPNSHHLPVLQSINLH